MLDGILCEFFSLLFGVLIKFNDVMETIWMYANAYDSLHEKNEKEFDGNETDYLRRAELSVAMAYKIFVL